MPYQYLSVYRSKLDFLNGKGRLGVLQIGVNKDVNGGDIGFYEFVGAGKGTDGGTWEWLEGSAGVEMHLTSNITKSKAAILKSQYWPKGMIPPNIPWYKYDLFNGNPMVYFDANGNTMDLVWTSDDPDLGY